MEALVVLCVIGVIAYVVKNNYDRQNRLPPKIREAEHPVQTIKSAPYFFRPSNETLDLISKLIFIGKADGQLRENEVLVLVALLHEKHPEHKEVPIDYLVERIREIKPPKTAEYRQFIGGLNKADLELFRLWVGRILGTQNKNHPFEEYLLEELADKMKAHLVKT